MEVQREMEGRKMGKGTEEKGREGIVEESKCFVAAFIIIPVGRHISFTLSFDLHLISEKKKRHRACMHSFQMCVVTMAKSHGKSSHLLETRLKPLRQDQSPE